MTTKINKEQITKVTSQLEREDTTKLWTYVKETTISRLFSKEIVPEYLKNGYFGRSDIQLSNKTENFDIGDSRFFDFKNKKIYLYPVLTIYLSDGTSEKLYFKENNLLTKWANENLKDLNLIRI